jgi:CheY-like chemotaxis protein
VSLFSVSSSEVFVEAGETPIFKGKRVLVAEDVEINREIVTTLLEPTGIIVTCAEDGAEALNFFSREPEAYDIILMDIQMPRMDGCEATMCIRNLDAPNAKTIPILAMTANIFREDIEYYLSVGMSGHIGKPMDIDAVFNAMKAFLG